ncbi:hypothetical protein OROHE_018655 [Orobanche hederae]
MTPPLRVFLKPSIRAGAAAAVPSSYSAAAAATDCKLRRMNAAIHMVVTKNYRDYDNHFKTLASVLGSEKAAKKAFVYSHGPLTTAFSAILTRDNVDQISKHPDVFDVFESKKIVFNL